MKLAIPDPSLVVLVGASGSGKTTFAAARFPATEIVSSDDFRARVSNDAASQEASRDAFELVHLTVEKRLARNLMTVVDATNCEDHAREALLGLARKHHVLAVALVLDPGEEECQRRNAARPDRRVPEEIVRRQLALLEHSLPGLEEGFALVHLLRSSSEMDAAELVREPLPCDRRTDRGPFDVVGDVHGCHAELLELLTLLGWQDLDAAPSHPDGRRLIFLGDLVDRGPGIVPVVRLGLRVLDAGTGVWLMGNHEAKLIRALAGKQVKIAHGLAQTLQEVSAEGEDFALELARRLMPLPDHLVLDEGRLVVAHAGMKESLQGRSGKAVRSFGLFGETTGETDEYGLPIRYPWAKDYRGQAVVAYGHTPIPVPEWINETICLDTGCVFGGSLSAMRWPEREIVSVPAHRAWYPSSRLFPRASG